MVAGTATITDRNDDYAAAAVKALKEKLRSYAKPGSYGRIVLEASIQNGVVQHLEVTVKEQIKV